MVCSAEIEVPVGIRRSSKKSFNILIGFKIRVIEPMVIGLGGMARFVAHLIDQVMLIEGILTTAMSMSMIGLLGLR
jgi:hypothetical protein